MKKSTSILAVAAVVGLSALTATPASAATIGVFPNCDAAEAAGAFNIPASDPRYGTHLDSDKDGIGCEQGGSGTAAQAPAQSQTRAQVAQKPVGGAPTGVEQETDNGMGFLALGGLAAAAATGSVIVRRRMAIQA